MIAYTSVFPLLLVVSSVIESSALFQQPAHAEETVSTLKQQYVFMPSHVSLKHHLLLFYNDCLQQAHSGRMDRYGMPIL